MRCWKDIAHETRVSADNIDGIELARGNSFAAVIRIGTAGMDVGENGSSISTRDGLERDICRRKAEQR